MRLHFAIIFALYLIATADARPALADEETVITFADAEVGKPVPSFTANDVTFEPASKLKQSKAVARVMFFPHLKTDKKGILNAMAVEAIPVQIKFPSGATKVTLKLWGSIGSAALVEALDKDGKVVDKAALEKVPQRTSPADPIPSFKLTVKAPQISAVRFSGANPGGFVAAEEVRFVPTAASSP